MKKNLIMIVALFTLMFTLVACGKKTKDPAYEGKEEIKASVFYGEFGTEWLKELANEWSHNTNSKYYISVSGDLNMANTVAADIRSGSSYDIYVLEDSTFQTLFPSGKLLDLTDVLSSKPDGTKTVREMINDFNTWEKVSSYNGKTYLLPYNVSPLGFIFDYDKFEENGWLVLDSEGNVSAGKDGIKGTYDDGQPTTWQEFTKMITKISVKTNEVFCYMGATNPQYVNNIAYAYMAQYMGLENYTKFIEHDTKGTQVLMNNGTMQSFSIEDGYKAVEMKGLRESLEFINQYLMNSQYVATKVLKDPSYSVDGTHMSFVTGDAALIIEGNWWEFGSKAIIDSYVDRKTPGVKEYGTADYRYMLLPEIEGQLTPADQSFVFSQTGGSICAVESQNEEKNAAIKDFLTFMLKNDNLAKVTVDTGMMWNYNYTINDELKTKMTKFQTNTYNMMHDTDHVMVRSIWIDPSSVPIYAYSPFGTGALYQGKDGAVSVVPMLQQSNNDVNDLYQKILTRSQSQWQTYLEVAKTYGFYK